MISEYRSAAAAVLASLFLLSSPVMADSGGSGDTAGDDDSNAMTYITIGLIVVVGGLFVLDVLSGSDEDTVPADTGSAQIIATGINWDAVFPENTALITIAVSVFPGENGSETAMQFISVLKELAGDNVAVYNEPLDLGTGSAVSSAKLAHDFFGVDYLVFQAEDSETLQYAMASPDSILWTSTDRSDNSIIVVAEEILQSGVF